MIASGSGAGDCCKLRKRNKNKKKTFGVLENSKRNSLEARTLPEYSLEIVARHRRGFGSVLHLVPVCLDGNILELAKVSIFFPLTFNSADFRSSRNVLVRRRGFRKLLRKLTT